MDPSSVPVGLAFLAGLASFLSPCVLSLVPAYIGYLSSRAMATSGPAAGGPGGAAVVANRWSTVSHGLAFVLGFSVVFVALGVTASAIGAAMYSAKDLLVRVGGLVVIVFGLHTMGVIHIPFLDYDTRRQQAPDARLGYASSALMGVFFSFGWAPCVGPVLGAVLTMALSSTGVNRGAVLLTAYSAGLGIPFLLAAAGVGNISQALKRYGKYLRYVSIVTGIFLIVVGVMLFTNTLSLFATMASFTQFQNGIDQGVIDFWHWITGQGG
jgi:cytochrome c-type biogenesis protein